MKKKIFDSKIYLEGLRQTRVMGIFLAVITVCGSALFPIFTILDYFIDNTYYTGVDPIPLGDFAPLLILFMFLGPIALTMNLFSFLNKRNSSDFYHALPCTRTCLFLSFSASVLTWVIGTLLVTVLANGLLYFICPATTVTLSVLLYTFVTCFFGSLLVTAVMLLAKSITGTALSNIIVGGIIGYLPRILTLVFVSILVDMVPIVEISAMGYFLNTAYNIPVNFTLGILNGLEETAFTFVDGMVSTFILAVVYFVLALFLFQRRKSETAQQSAPNKIMQHIIRCLITIPITLVLPVLYLDGYLEVTTTVTILFIAAIIYFGYELLSTRKVKNLLVALPIFLVVILFDVLFGAALVGTQAAILSDTPSDTEIDSVCISLEPEVYSEFEHYNLLLAEDYYIEDDTMVKSVSDALERSVDAVKDGSFYNKLYGSESYYSFPVAIRKNSGTVINRILLFTVDEMEYLNELYKADAGYQKKLTQLPEEKSISDVYIYGISDSTAVEQIWEAFREEYESMVYEEKLVTNGIGFYLGSAWGDDSMDPVTVSVRGYRGVTPYAVDYTISAKTPKAYTLYLEAVNKDSAESVKIFWEELETLKAKEDDALTYNMFFTNVSGEQSCYFDLYLSESGVWNSVTTFTYPQTEDMLSALKEATTRATVDFSQPVYCLDLRREKWDEEDDGNYKIAFSVYFNLTEEELELLKPYVIELSDDIYTESYSETDSETYVIYG